MCLLPFACTFFFFVQTEKKYFKIQGFLQAQSLNAVGNIIFPY